MNVPNLKRFPQGIPQDITFTSIGCADIRMDRRTYRQAEIIMPPATTIARMRAQKHTMFSLESL